MAIVLNEYNWVEEVLADNTMSKHPIEALGRIAKYYFYKNYRKQDIRKLLENYILQRDCSASIVKWSNAIDSAIKYAAKHDIVMIDDISISRSEMDKIDSLPGAQLKRLAFTLLCIAKYSHAAHPSNEYWVNTPDNEIMNMANISTSVKRQSAMFTQLKDAGLIKFSNKIDSLSVQVLFVGGEDAVLYLDDFRNLGYQYLKFHGDPYYECESCGIVTKIKEPKKGRPPKYCADCAIKISTQQRVDSVMRSRYKKNKNVEKNNSEKTA